MHTDISFNEPVHFSVNMAGISEYKINGSAKRYADYDKALQDINILVKARNFLVFQVGDHYS